MLFRNYGGHLVIAVSLAVFATTMGDRLALADEARTSPTSTPQVPATAADRGNILEEVVVTAARKRSEDVQSTPITITAMNADTLDRNHVTDFSQMGQLVPNLQTVENSGSGGEVDVYLRGFGSNSNDPAEDPHLAIFVDGIYQPALVGTNFDMFDLAGVEVDAGPQGTLAGKNAPIGAIYITSARPGGDFGGTIQLDYGSYDHVGVRGKVNVPILKDSAGNSVLAAKISFSEKNGGNWVYNLATGKRDEAGEDTQSGKLAIAFTPGDRFTWDLIGSITQDRSPQRGDQPADYLGGYPGTQSSAAQVPPYACAILGPTACPKLPYGDGQPRYRSAAPRSDKRVLDDELSLRSGYTDFGQRVRPLMDA